MPTQPMSRDDQARKAFFDLLDKYPGHLMDGKIGVVPSQRRRMKRPSRTGRFLCRVGFHSWRHVHGDRHWSVECRRCGSREIWEHYNRGASYHPVDRYWLDRKERPAPVPPTGGSGVMRPSID